MSLISILKLFSALNLRLIKNYCYFKCETIAAWEMDKDLLSIKDIELYDDLDLIQNITNVNG
jgi:hypothetical protein